MAYTSNSVVNEALNAIGYDGPAVTGTAPSFDSSTPGQIAANVYAPSVAAVARSHGWAFTRTAASLTTTGNAAPFPWSYEYTYPANCVDLWQVTPASLTDPYNPIPVDWARGIALVSSVQTSVIWTNVQNAHAVYNGNPLESTWDPLFHQAVVNYLAYRFAVANLGKPDLCQMYIEQFGQMAQVAATRDDQ